MDGYGIDPPKMLMRYLNRLFKIGFWSTNLLLPEVRTRTRTQLCRRACV